MERARLEGELETTKNSNKEENEVLKSQNATIREESKKEKMLLQAEVTKERDKVINMEQELKFLTDEIKRKEMLYNQELQTTEASLEEMKSRKEIAERELKKLHELTEERIEELKNSYKSKLEGLKHELDSVHHEKVRKSLRYHYIPILYLSLHYVEVEPSYFDAGEKVTECQLDWPLFDKCVSFSLLYFDWIIILTPFFRPIRSISKTNHLLFAPVFPRFASSNFDWFLILVSISSPGLDGLNDYTGTYPKTCLVPSCSRSLILGIG